VRSKIGVQTGATHDTSIRGHTLSGIYRRSLPGGPDHLEFHYGVVRAWQQPVEPVLLGGLGTLPMAPVTRLDGMEPEEVIRRMEERIDREPREDAGKLWSATGILMGLQYHREEVAWLLRGVRGMKESSFYQMILEEGEAKGVAKGEAKGQLKEARRILLRQGERRFGPPDQGTLASLESIGQTERIEELLDRLLDVSSWEELLSPPTEGE
jgi:hypothetical protein